MDVRSFIAVLLAGVLTGSELTSWGIVHPTLWKLDHVEQVRTEKLMYRRFAGVCCAVMLAITPVGNMPINLRVFRWDEQHGDPGQWRALRHRWDHLHGARVLLDMAGFVLIILAALHV
ncbi:MAG: DUF1772 domain-containing protein [Solirubrobacteraceae bacterium]